MQRVLSVLTIAMGAVVTTPAMVAGQAQVSVLAGATFTTLRGVDNLDTRTGILGGLSVVTSSSALAWQPEILFTSKGAKGTNRGPNGVRIDYVEVPLLLRLSPVTAGPVRPHVYAGPYVGLQLKCTVQGTDGDCEDRPPVSTRTVDVGGVAGGGVTMAVGGILLTGGARYGFGVSEVADFDVSNVRESARNGAWALYAGVGVKLGR